MKYLVKFVDCLLSLLTVDGHGDLLAREVTFQFAKEFRLAFLQHRSVKLEKEVLLLYYNLPIYPKMYPHSDFASPNSIHNFPKKKYLKG